tara:strand:+ start:765 stop:2018 length:1254 start_codon:yes stop_codon:yes gene_type:complete
LYVILLIIVSKMKIDNLNKVFYFLLSISIFIELYFNIDSAGSGGFIADFKSTWPLVENPLNFSTNLDIKFPLHYYIAAVIYKLSNDKEIFRFVYCLISLVIPYLFFLCLKIKFKEIKLNNLFLFSLIIFLLPSFRSAAIWPNTQITGIFFFLVSLLFFLKWEIKKQFNKFNKELFFTILFMSLTVYTRQLYAMIFFYLMIIFYLNLDRKTFLKTVLIVGLLSLPGFLFILLWPKILKATFVFKLYNSLLVNSSIISFYLIPFFSSIFFFKKKIELDKNKLLGLLFIIIFTFICSLFFDYNYLMGGGYFIKLSKILFGNFLFFYLSSIIGLFLLYYISQEDKLNFILSVIILFTVSAYIIFMKYYEPMFIILLFLLFKTNLTKIFLNNKKIIYFYHLYFSMYLVTAIINSFLLLSKNI